MIYVSALLAIVLFAVGLWATRLLPAASKAIEISRGAIATMRDPGLSDDEKERATQRASLALMRNFLSIVLRVGVAVLASLIPLFLFDWSGPAPIGQTVAWLESWEAIGLATVAMTGWYFAARKR